MPVLGRYDVVVAGGGTGGAPAGIGAARQGARTLVLEYLHGLGGVGTLGLIGKYYYGNVCGFTEEINRGVAALSGRTEHAEKEWHIEPKMEWYRRELLEAGADIWFGAIVCGAYVDGGMVKGVVVATPEGRGVVLAHTVIDATGNSDVAAAAGAACSFTDGTTVAVQGTGMPPRKPGAFYTNTDYTFTDDTSAVDHWRTFVVGRTKYSSAYDLGQLVDSRERRRIVGDFVISPLDILNGRTYPDTVVRSYSNFDTHGYTIHPVFSLSPPDKTGMAADVPFRSLLPQGLDGILVTGLGISAHRDAMPILRMQADIQNQGYAAGVAAAMAAASGAPVRRIDVRALQRHLIEKGNLEARVLGERDSFPRPYEEVLEAVKRLGQGYDGLSLVLAQPEESMRYLPAAYASAENPEERLIYAHVLGMLGHAEGADTLKQTVSSLPWDEGWNFTGGGQYGMSLSRLDSYIIALARTATPGALELILEKAAELDENSAFSHHRAVAMALEELADPAAAPVLAALLRKPGMTGYAATGIRAAMAAGLQNDPNQSRNVALRELILARALFRCGDHEELGETILRKYAGDLRGHYARHAIGVLREDSITHKTRRVALP